MELVGDPMVTAMIEHVRMLMADQGVDLDMAVQMAWCNARDDKPHEYFSGVPALRGASMDEITWCLNIAHHRISRGTA